MSPRTQHATAPSPHGEASARPTVLTVCKQNCVCQSDRALHGMPTPSSNLYYGSFAAVISIPARSTFLVLLSSQQAFLRIPSSMAATSRPRQGP